MLCLSFLVSNDSLIFQSNPYVLGKENGGRVVQFQNTNQSLECFVNKKNYRLWDIKKLNVRTQRSVGKYAWSLYAIISGSRKTQNHLCLEAV